MNKRHSCMYQTCAKVQHSATELQGLTHIEQHPIEPIEALSKEHV